jgi:menaquinone-specific isochorismate synthase
VTRFAFRPGETAFVGATPERLVARRGLSVASEALAGSAARSEALLASRKDLGEHGFVVREIARRLRPLCRSLTVGERPDVRELRHVLHLHTPIEGVLAEPTHVLELVEALHPTPAVAGVPTDGALAWIAARESAPRGWYAGPVGWLDGDGDGEFAVALRSGVVDGARAWLYAGAGIVRDSDPRAEYDELELKQRALAAALGAV